MANSPADRNTEATFNPPFTIDTLVSVFNENPVVETMTLDEFMDRYTVYHEAHSEMQQRSYRELVREWKARAAHERELDDRRKRATPRPPAPRVAQDKMHIYVNGKRVISVDADKAHAVAESYIAQGDNVWVTRKAVSA